MTPETRLFFNRTVECVGQVALLTLGIIYVGPTFSTCRAISSVLLSVFGLSVIITVTTLLSDYRKFRRERHVLLQDQARKRYFDRIIEERKK